MKEDKTCINCTSPCHMAIDLGEIYPSTFVADEHKIPNKSKLCLLQCESCGLVQQEVIVNQDETYRQYWYRSSLNSSMMDSLKDIVTNIEKRIELKDHDVVIDIGCNDGSLFQLYNNKILFKIGFDPAINLKEAASKNCDEFVNDYYRPYYKNIYLGVGESPWHQELIKAKVITAIAMFYDLPDPHAFIEDVKKNLKEDGIFVIQMTDLYSMLKANAFDNICHEHIEVYSVKVLHDLLKSHGLEIFEIEYNNVNGGSLRAYVKFGNGTNAEIAEIIEKENEFLAKPENSFKEFKNRIDGYKKIVVDFINAKNAEGKKIFLMGASTKGNTLLQYFGINNNMIPYAAEVNSSKFGLKTIGTNIEIISNDEALSIFPDIFLVLPWHFRDGMIKNNLKYLESGGALLFPLPTPELVTKNGVIKLN